MNLQVISQSREQEIDRSLLKILFLGLLGVGFSVLSVFFFNRYLISAQPHFFWGAVLGSAAFFVMMILQVFSIKSAGKLNIILFFETIAPLAIFYDKIYPEPSRLLIGGALVAFIFAVLGANQGLKLLANSIKISFWPTSKAILPKAVTGFLVLLSVIFYLNYFKWGNFNDQLGQKLLDGLLLSGEPIIKLQWPGVSFNDKFGDFLFGISESQLKKMKLPVTERAAANFRGDFKTLPPEAKKQLIERTALELEKVIENYTGPIDSAKQTRILIYELIKKYVGSLSASSRFLLSLGAVAVVFFTMKGLAALFYWLIIFVAFVVFKFLIVIGFAYVSLESRSREFILLS